MTAAAALAAAGLAPCLGCKCRGPVAPGDGRGEVAEPAASAPEPEWEPAYLALHRSGELKRRGEELTAVMAACRLCPRQCGVDRLAGQEGFCQSSAQLEISSYHPHFGEEAPLVGQGGSGTIFLTNCGLRCVFCINWEINHEGIGRAVDTTEMAMMMMALQAMGCPNINLVTPTHYAAHNLLALDQAAGMGLRLPVVYNTCGYERLEVLQQLDGVVDIYLPDCKYADGTKAATYSSSAADYPEVTHAAILEMQRQVGVARPEENGLMRRGLMIRHLVMPSGVSGSEEVMSWIAANLPADTYVNIMSQYTPVFRAHEFPEIDRPITREEYETVVTHARELGLTNLDIQGFRG